MSEAAAEAARGKTDSERAAVDLASVSQALEALWLAWGDCYLCGCDEKGYWAARPDRVASLMRAETPEELGRLLADDFGPGPS